MLRIFGICLFSSILRESKYSGSAFRARPHLCANANKACGPEANANECQKVACSVFAAQANEQTFCWLFVGCPNKCTSTSVWLRTYFSLKYRLQMDNIRLFAKHKPHKRMKASAVRLHIHIMRFACLYAFVSCLHTDVDAALYEHFYLLRNGSTASGWPYLELTCSLLLTYLIILLGNLIVRATHDCSINTAEYNLRHLWLWNNCTHSYNRVEQELSTILLCCVMTWSKKYLKFICDSDLSQWLTKK